MYPQNVTVVAILFISRKCGRLNSRIDSPSLFNLPPFPPIPWDLEGATERT